MVDKKRAQAEKSGRRFVAESQNLTIKRPKERIDLSKDHSSSTHPDIPNKPGKTNWVEDMGGLPSFIRRVAKHIKADSGYTTSRAIAAAVSQCKKGRLGAKGLAAYAEFKAKAAAARAS